MSFWDEVTSSENQNLDKSKKFERPGSCIEYGAICPQCRAAHLKYDGKLNLVCPTCQYEAAAGFT